MGGDCQTLVYGEESHVLPPLFVFHFFLSHPTLSTSLMLQLVVEGSYCLWEWGGRTVSPLPTSTHHPQLHSHPVVRPPHAERSAIHPRAEAAVYFLTQLGFNLHDGGRFPARA